MRTASGAPGSTGRRPVVLGRVEQRTHGCERYPRGTTAPVRQRSIGNDTVGRVSVGAIGLGAMPLSTKEHRPSPTDAEAVVHAALDAGVTLIDTADAYARDESEFGHNEDAGGQRPALLRRAPTSSWRPRAATPGAARDWELDGSPAYLRRACEASLRRLHVDAIGLYQFHRPDPATPWEESMGALRSLFDDGLVRMVGISNADIAQIDAARAIVGDALVSVQNQFSPGYRSSAGELAHCAARRAGVAALESVRRGVGRRLAGRGGPRLRRGGRGARGLGVPGDAGLAPRAGRRRHPDPGCVAAGVHLRLRRRGRPRPLPRPARPAERRLTTRDPSRTAAMIGAWTDRDLAEQTYDWGTR